MNAFNRHLRVPTLLIGATVFVAAGTTRGGDTNFPGNVTVTSNLFVNGSLAVTNIGPAEANASISISAADGDCDNGGSVLITGGASCNGDDGWLGGDVTLQGGRGRSQNGGGGNLFLEGGSATNGSPGGTVILQGGMADQDGTAGDVILRNRDNSPPTGPNNGYVKLQTSNGTTRFYLQQDGTLNANDNYLKQARVVPQGDLSMGSYTNHP